MFCFPLIASSLKKQLYLIFVCLMLFFNLSYDMFLSKCVFIYVLVVVIIILQYVIIYKVSTMNYIVVCVIYQMLT